MNLIVLVITVAVYLVVLAFLGYLGYTRTKNSADYLIAGRKVHPVIMAISYGATFISTSAIIGFGGAAAVYGMGVLWLTVLNISVGIFIAFVFFGKRTRQMGHNLDAHTFPELVGRRFQSRSLQVIAGALVFLGMPLYAGSVIIGGAQFLAQSLSVSYEAALFFFVGIVALYVVMGGLKGVMYTDAFQGTIMFIGMALLLIFTYSNLGGILQAHESLTALAPEAVKLWGKAGHLGWTSMPATGSPFWWQLVSTIVMGVGIGVLAQPQLAVRFMTVKSDRELNRGVLIGGVFIMMMTGVAFIVGSLSNVYFQNNPAFGAVSIVAAGKNVENIIPLYITNAMPQWFTIIFLVSMLAAAMSTLSSQFHTMGSSFGRDILEQGAGIKLKNSILTTKLAMGVGIVIATFVAWALPRFYSQGTAIIATGTAIFMGLCAATLLPLYIGTLYIKRTTRQGAIAGFTGGLVMSLFWLLFMHVKESGKLGLCKMLFGMDSLGAGTIWQEIDPIVVSLPVSIILTIAVTMLTQPPEESHLKLCFGKIEGKAPAEVS